MALSNLRSTPSTPKKGPDCSVCLALEVLPKDQAKVLLDALSNKLWRYSEIAEQVSSDASVPEWIRNIRPHTYRKHAVGQCWARQKLRK